MVSRKVPEEVPKQIELCTCMDGGWKSDLGPVQMVPELWRTWRRDGAAWPLSCLHQALLQSSLSLLLGDMLSTCSPGVGTEVSPAEFHSTQPPRLDAEEVLG
jgi:hypothetical protein